MLVQTDRKWSGVCFEGQHTIGEEGCLLVCLCMANRILGNPLDPKKLAMQLSEVGGFFPNGDLLWVKLRQTSSIVWLCMGEANPLHCFRLIEYARPRGGSHFVLEYCGVEFDSKPETERVGVHSIRRLALIPKG